MTNPMSILSRRIIRLRSPYRSTGIRLYWLPQLQTTCTISAFLLRLLTKSSPTKSIREILPNLAGIHEGPRAPIRDLLLSQAAGLRVLVGRQGGKRSAAGGGVHAELLARPCGSSSESVGWQSFGKMLLVFGCIGSDFCKKICVLQHFSKSTRLSS